MSRPQIPLPTPKELEALQVLWEHEPCSVARVTEILSRRRARSTTSVKKLLDGMTEKGMLMCKPHGDEDLYKSRINRERTNGGLVKDLLNRAFAGSTVSLVTHLLQQAQPSVEELDEINRALGEFRERRSVR